MFASRPGSTAYHVLGSSSAGTGVLAARRNYRAMDAIVNRIGGPSPDSITGTQLWSVRM